MFEIPHRQLHIARSASARPPSARAIFCDGGIDETYRVDVDLELSHWIPNTTPARYKASTSTEICMRYIEAADDAEFDLVINNHIDVDGVLSTFVLLHPQVSLRHRETIVQAAEMGDFAAWGDTSAQYLCQSLLLHITEMQAQRLDPQDIYLRCYQRIHAVLSGRRPAECEPAIVALRTSLDNIAHKVIARTPVTERLTQYVVPKELAERDLSAALFAPRFDTPLSATAWLPPHARAKFDRERAQLVSIETSNGHHHDLWYPGYAWAETVGWWQPPGLHSTGSSNRHILDYPPLAIAAATLQQHESAEGQWILARELSPFGTVAGRNFPIVLSFMRADQPSVSNLSPSFVASTLTAVFSKA
jgi:hypothetical protein